MDNPINKRERQFIVVLVMVGLIAGISLFMPNILDLISGAAKVDASAVAYFQTPTATELVLIPAQTAPGVTVAVTGTTSADISADQEYGCTYDRGFWISHIESWPLQEIQLGGETHSKDQLRLLINLSAPNAREDLLIELVVYTLNVFQGSDGSTIAQSVAGAIDWLDDHPQGSEFTDSERDTADRLADILSDYNHGEIGPGLCKKTVFLANSLMIDTPAISMINITPTFTPTIIEELTPSTSTFVFIPIPTSTKKPKNDSSSPKPAATQLPPTARPGEPPSTSAPTPAER